MIVYHGSYTAIDTIDMSKGELRRDFGRGFYVTKFRKQAEIWAVRQGKRKHTDGVITEFEFDEYAYIASHLNVLRFDDYSEAWLDFVVMNRQNDTD